MGSIVYAVPDAVVVAFWQVVSHCVHFRPPSAVLYFPPPPSLQASTPESPEHVGLTLLRSSTSRQRTAIAPSLPANPPADPRRAALTSAHSNEHPIPAVDRQLEVCVVRSTHYALLTFLPVSSLFSTSLSSRARAAVTDASHSAHQRTTGLRRFLATQRSQSPSPTPSHRPRG